MADKPNESTKRTPYEVITAGVLEQMKQPMEKWERPWARPGLALPKNATTDRSYSGVNVPVLWCTSNRRGYREDTWATFNQWKKEGATVRKGEHGTPVLFFKTYEPKVDDRAAGKVADAGIDGDEKAPRRIPIARISYVFNASQVDGAKAAPAPEPVPLDQRYENAERILRESGATIRNGYTRSYYDPQLDEIHLPNKSDFKAVGGATGDEAYYATAFHELTHWSGAHDRLDRQFGKRFGDKGYAQEELTAELGSAFLCVKSGVTPTAREDHAQYLASWQQVLKDDPKAFTRAASAAQKASDFILTRGRERVQEREHAVTPERVPEVDKVTVREAGPEHDFSRGR